MAKDPHANAFIKSLKVAKEKGRGRVSKVHRKVILTSSDQKDVQDYQHFLTQAKQMSKVMWTDVMEVDQAIDGFGGASDTFFHSADGMLRNLRKRLTEAVLGVACVVAASR